VPLDEMNPPASGVSGVQLAWTQASDGMGFGDLRTQPDVQGENLLNRAIWYGTRGFDVPYPGDARVLWPQEVASDSKTEEVETEAQRTERRPETRLGQPGRVSSMLAPDRWVLGTDGGIEVGDEATDRDRDRASRAGGRGGQAVAGDRRGGIGGVA
jgi:hypothetical protein